MTASSIENSSNEANFDWQQHQIEDAFSSAFSFLLSLIFFLNYILKSRARVHIVLGTSTALLGVNTLLIAYAVPLCQQPGNWTVFLVGQLQRMTLSGGIVLYQLFVIARLTYFDTMMPGLHKWKRPLQMISVGLTCIHLILEFLDDYATYTGKPPLAGNISTAIYLLSMLLFFVVNFTINYKIAKCFIKHALENSKDVALGKQCRRLLVLLYCSIIATLGGTILFAINFDTSNLPLFHIMNILTTLGLSGHFYFEWLYQVLLTTIMNATNLT